MKHSMPSHHALLAFVLFAVACLLEASLQPASAQDWPTTEWEVTTMGTVGSLDEAVKDEYREWVSKDLQAASAWLEGIGYEKPELRLYGGTEGGRYVTTFDYNYAENRPNSASGAYYDNEEKKIFLNPRLFRDGSGDPQAPDALRDGHVTYSEGYMLSGVHELFHAVQEAYTPIEPTLDPLKWIWEGAAEAVRYAWAGKEYGTVYIPGRDYDFPLHNPRIGTGNRAQLQAYNTGHFWYYLGEDLGAPDRISYLRSVLEELRKDTDESRQGLGPVARALEVHDGGLYNLYPQFIARHAHDPDDHFHRPKRLSLRRAEVIFDDETDLIPLEPLTTNAYQVQAHVPPGETAGLEIEFERDHEALHLIVDAVRYDLPASVEDERNVFRTALTGREEPYEFFVRVANVGPEPAETEARRYTLRLALSPIDACDGDRMWAAIHPDIRTRTQLLPPAEYEQRYPDHHVAVGELRISGLVNDGGVTCTQPVQVGTDPEMAPAEVAQWGERMQQQIQGMSEEELMEMAQRLEEAGPGRTPDQYVQGALETAEESGMDPLPNKSTLISIFSPNALSWQRHLRTELPSPSSIRDALFKDDPLVPYDHAGVGGWLSNSGVDVSIIIPGKAPSELREDTEYEARATLGYSRGEGKVVKTRRSVAGPGHRGYSPTWQVFEGWHEQLRPDASSGEPWMMRGTVTIEEITGASIRGTFDLSGVAHWMRAECPKNPLNRLGIQRRCKDEQRDGPVSITGRFEAPATELSRDP